MQDETPAPATQWSWSLLTREDLISWRTGRGLSHRDVALLLGVARRTVSFYEAGARVPSRELQALMVEVIRSEQLTPARTRGHRARRRHRWRRVKPFELKAWREANNLSREEVAGILGVHPSTISGWERDEWAPPSHTQRRLRSLVGSRPLNIPAPPPVTEQAASDIAAIQSRLSDVRYDDDRKGMRGMPVTTTEPTTKVAEEGDDLNIRRRIGSTMTQYGDNRLHLRQYTAECRWDVQDGVAVIASKIVKGAVYLFDQVTGQFYRTVAPDSTRIMSCNPREVLQEDRRWLYPLLQTVVPGGKNVVNRYHSAAVPMNDASPTPRSATATTPIPPKERTVTTTPADRALDFPIVEGKTIVLISRTLHTDLAPHQIHALLRRAGREVPDAAEVKKGDGDTLFTVTWGAGNKNVPGRFFDEVSSNMTALNVKPSQLREMLVLAGRGVGEKPAMKVTDNGYVRVEWVENEEKVSDAA